MQNILGVWQMKNLVAYYSWTGNTEVVAKEVHKLVGGDLKRIEEGKKRTTGIGFMGAAFSALTGMKSKLKPMDFTLKEYDNIFLGSQVWASHSTPAINAFINKAQLKDKMVYLFLTKADDKVPQKVIDSITKRIEKRGGKAAGCFSLTTRMGSVITPDAVKEPVSEWINNVNNL